MKIEQVSRIKVPADRFIYWIKERHRIHLSREEGKEKPWTDDEVLQNYFFTNPFRENDKVTKWVEAHIRKPYADHRNLWFMLCIARQINRPETLEEMMGESLWPVKTWKPVEVAKLWNDRQERGEPIYTGAYMIRAESDPEKPWYSWTKQEYMSQIVLGRVWDKRKAFEKVVQSNSLETVCDWLKTFHGWGGFMAYEVVSDLRHTRYLRDATDIMTWANPGPGAQRGLNRIFERPLKKSVNYLQAITEMQSLLDTVNRSLPTWVPRFEMRDVEHSLCEFDKYERMRLGQGRSKRKYKGV